MIETIFSNSIEKVGPTGLAFTLIKMSKDDFWKDKSNYELEKVLNILKTENCIDIYRESINRIDNVKNKEKLLYAGELSLQKMIVAIENELLSR